MNLHIEPWLKRQATTVTGVDRVPTRRRVGILMALCVGVVLAGACFQAQAGDYEAVWIFDSQGVPQLCTTDIYQSGHVYQLPSYTEIGTTNSAGFIISDASGQEIGFIDPSQASADYGL